MIKSLKSLCQFNQVIIIMERNMIVIRDPKTFCFDFNWPKDVDENLKHQINFIIKSNESLAENNIINKIEKLLLKYKHRHDIHEHKNNEINELHKCSSLFTKIRLVKSRETCCTSKLIYL